MDAFILGRRRAKSLHLQGMIAGILEISYKIEMEYQHLEGVFQGEMKRLFQNKAE